MSEEQPRLMNVLLTTDKHLFSSEVLLVDTADDTIVHRLAVEGIHFKDKGYLYKEDGSSPYHLHHLILKNKDAEKFLEIAEHYWTYLCMLGYPDYQEFCRHIVEKIEGSKD